MVGPDPKPRIPIPNPVLPCSTTSFTTCSLQNTSPDPFLVLVAILNPKSQTPIPAPPLDDPFHRLLPPGHSVPLPIPSGRPLPIPVAIPAPTSRLPVPNPVTHPLDDPVHFPLLEEEMHIAAPVEIFQHVPDHPPLERGLARGHRGHPQGQRQPQGHRQPHPAGNGLTDPRAAGVGLA